MEYVIECRYQFHSREGVLWTDWFTYESKHLSGDDVKNRIKELYEISKSTDKITKLKHEYRERDAADYEAYYENMLKEVEKEKKEFLEIKRMKKPWLAKARKERKELREMDNTDKVLHLAKKRENQL